MYSLIQDLMRKILPELFELSSLLSFHPEQLWVYVLIATICKVEQMDMHIQQEEIVNKPASRFQDGIVSSNSLVGS